MEGKTAIIPGQPAMGNDAPRLAFEIRDHVFITDIEDTRPAGSTRRQCTISRS